MPTVPCSAVRPAKTLKKVPLDRFLILTNKYFGKCNREEVCDKESNESDVKGHTLTPRGDPTQPHAKYMDTV